MGAQLVRLFEGHPDRRAVAFLQSRAPEHHDIDAATGNAV
jgi:hypothetical protein